MAMVIPGCIGNDDPLQKEFQNVHDFLKVEFDDVEVNISQTIHVQELVPTPMVHTGKQLILVKVKVEGDVLKAKKVLVLWQRTETPERFHYVIKFCAPEMRDISFAQTAEITKSIRPCAVLFRFSFSTHGPSPRDDKFHSHYQPQNSKVLELLSSPGKVEVFTDQFYDLGGYLEKKGVWLSRRDGQWRLKYVEPFNNERFVDTVLVTHVITHIPDIEKTIKKVFESSKEKVTLEHMKPTCESIFTLRVTTNSGIIDLARLPNKEYYAVMARCVLTDPSSPPFCFNDAVPTPSKLFALRMCSNTDVKSPTTIPIEELPMPILRYLRHTSGLAMRLWNRSVLSAFLPEPRFSKYVETDGQDKFLNRLLAWVDDESPFEHLVSALHMKHDAKAVQELDKKVKEFNAMPIRGEKSSRMTLEVVVATWMDQLFEGVFEPFYDGLNPLPDESPAQAWPKIHKKLMIIIDVDKRAVLPEEICEVIGVECDYNVRRLLKGRGFQLRIPDVANHVRTRFVSAVRDNMRLLQFGNIKDTTPRGKARRFVSNWSFTSNVNESNPIVSVEFKALDSAFADNDSQCTDQLFVLLHTDGVIGSPAQDSPTGTNIMHGPHNAPKELQDLIAQLRAIDAFKLHVNVRHIVPWMLDVGNQPVPPNQCPVDQLHVGVPGSAIFVSSLNCTGETITKQLTFTTVADPEGSHAMHVVTCAHGFRHTNVEPVEFDNNVVHDVSLSNPNGRVFGRVFGVGTVTPHTMGPPPLPSHTLDLAVMGCSQVVVGVVRHSPFPQALHLQCDGVDARKSLHQPFHCPNTPDSDLKVSKTGGITSTTSESIVCSETRSFNESSEFPPSLWLVAKGPFAESKFGEEGDSGAPVYTFSTPTATTTLLASPPRPPSTSSPPTPPSPPQASLIGMLVGSTPGFNARSLVLPLDRILDFLDGNAKSSHPKGK
eukprot:m.261284 g.261284  ORF g.261284 m.261284 type:complete len:938 (-) comp41798_c0_seq1:217-3030(-)